MTTRLTGGVAFPRIYAYTTEVWESAPWKGKREGVGIIKVGKTNRPGEIRVLEQVEPVKMPEDTKWSLLLLESRITNDGRVFDDKDVHRVLEKAGCHNPGGEWFECTLDEVKAAIQAVREGADMPSLRPIASFAPREEQVRAVTQTAQYFRANPRTRGGRAPTFLWNAKMRFGKTFTAYQLAREMGWKRILVLTFKPAVARAWHDDLSHRDFQGWRFKGKNDESPVLSDPGPLVWFASFQDALGRDSRGQTKPRNRALYEVEWDVVILDEYHYGAWRDAARALYLGEVDEATEEKTEGDRSERGILSALDLEEDLAKDIISEQLENVLKVHHMLFLSGTPFRALTNGEFLEDQVFNWTYSDEQRAKKRHAGRGSPYAALPQMRLLAYEMPEALRQVALNNFSEFSLTEFFKTKKSDSGDPQFIHELEVQKWLDLLRGQDLSDLWATVSVHNRPPMPFEGNLLETLMHTLWYLPGVDACYAMRDLLQRPHNKFFRDYQVVVAAGTQAGMGEEALKPVELAIGRVPQETKTITLSCAKLMTGVTVPAWTGIFMLRELSSPETYFQAAFRVQSPWTYQRVNVDEGGEDTVVVKHQCYVIDFSPNRALRLLAEYATKLGTAETQVNQEAALAEFIEFLPVLAFDGSSMINVNAGGVIDYLTQGLSATMLARRWNSPELVTLDRKAMERLLDDPALLTSLEELEMFRNLSNDLSALISSNRELIAKKVRGEKLTQSEREGQDEARKKRSKLKEKLQVFLMRIPVFLYLTDDREKEVVDIIRQDEPELFEMVTTLRLSDFDRLVTAGVFHRTKMDDAVWKFRQFEEPSLSYEPRPEPVMRGGWALRRDERFAELIERAVLMPGEVLTNGADSYPITVVVSDDFGLLLDGVRQESPDEAAAAASGNENVDGWTYWMVERPGSEPRTLAEIRKMIPPA